MLLGAQSKREVQRSRFRTLAAMRAQVREQGRYQGGRPPYGYRLADAGPHPNAAHARWGRRLQRLQPDPATAPQVRWMFAQRLAGHSVAGIARDLNERGVPCPSNVDRERNRHRSGAGWTTRTVAAILANPRYTGRQVWGRRTSNSTPKRASTADPEEIGVCGRCRYEGQVVQRLGADDGVVREALRLGWRVTQVYHRAYARCCRRGPPPGQISSIGRADGSAVGLELVSAPVARSAVDPMPSSSERIASIAL
jgi:hypothetical protein